MTPHARWRPLALVLMVVALLSGCGAAEKSSTPAAASTSSAAATLGAPVQAAPPSTVQARATTGDRLGCGTSCQSAGGYGAPGDEGVDAVTILSSGPVPLDPDGYAPLTLRCNLPVPCSGEILACAKGVPESAGFGMACGRSDEEVGPGATRTLGIALPTPVLAVVAAQGSTSVQFTVNTVRTPRCEEIPQLAAQCAAIPWPHNSMPPEGIVRTAVADLVVTEPTTGFGARSAADNAASLRTLEQTAAGDRPFVSADLADRWVVQLSAKRPGVVDDGFTWDDTLILDEHQRLRDRFAAKLVWSGDWTSFDAKDLWVTISSTTYPDAAGALGWCWQHGMGVNYCAARLVSATRPPDGAFAHQ